MAEADRVSETNLRPLRGFRASLTGVDLASLLQMTCARGERAVLRVRSGGREGFIYVAERRVVHASLGYITGEHALVLMLRFTHGDFSFCERPWPLRNTIQDSLEAVLIRTAQSDDEQARASGVSPSEAAPEQDESETAQLVATLHKELHAADPRSQLGGEGDVLTSVRIDVNGQIVSHHGNVDTLAPLVAYVTRMGAILGTQLGLAPFEALSAKLGAQRALIFVDGAELVGLLLADGPTCTELRRQLGV